MLLLLQKQKPGGCWEFNMGKISEKAKALLEKAEKKRKEFVERTRRKGTVGVKFTKYGRIFKVKKYG